MSISESFGCNIENEPHILCYNSAADQIRRIVTIESQVSGGQYSDTETLELFNWSSRELRKQILIQAPHVTHFTGN